MPLQFRALLLLVLCTANTVSSTFVYSNAPEDLVQEARLVGENERQAFVKELSKSVNDETDKMKSLEIEMELYSKHLMACSSVGPKLTQDLHQAIGDQMVEDETRTRTHQILQSVGFDEVSSRMFTLPTDQIRSTIKTACLKHELQFECANSFVNNPEKIRQNIDKMKTVDGNVKLMFEKECVIDEESRTLPQIYSCIGQAAEELQASCSSSIEVFNKKVKKMSQIHKIYQSTMDSIDDEALLTEEEYKSNAKKIEETMREIIRMEAVRCRVYDQVEKCAVNTIADMCGSRSREVVETLLRVGRLRRERGDFMHEHFLDLGIAEHKHCSNYV